MTNWWDMIADKLRAKPASAEPAPDSFLTFEIETKLGETLQYKHVPGYNDEYRLHMKKAFEIRHCYALPFGCRREVTSLRGTRVMNGDIINIRAKFNVVFLP